MQTARVARGTGQVTMARAMQASLRCGVVIALCAALTATAAEWPVRPVRILVPFAAGGVTDSIARISAEWMSLELEHFAARGCFPQANPPIVAPRKNGPPVWSKVNFFAIPDRQHGVEMRGQRQQRGVAPRSHREGDHIPGTVDPGVVAQRLELRQHPFSPFLFKKRRGGHAANLQMLIVDPALFAREPLEAFADTRFLRDFGNHPGGGGEGAGSSRNSDVGRQASSVARPMLAARLNLIIFLGKEILPFRR